MMGRYRPTQNDLGKPEDLERVFRIVFDELYRTPTAIAEALAAEEKRLPSLLKQNITVVRQELQANGNAPLNLTSLPGIPANVSQILQDTHANRLALYPVANYPNSAFWETDRLILYVADSSTGTPVWKYAAGVNYALFASRPTDLGTGDNGFKFYATDQGVNWYWNGTVFKYDYGIYQRTQAQLAALAALLGANDAGYLVEVTDFSHLLRWGGAAWAFDPTDSGSGMIVGFPFAPTGGTWGLCDGTTYSYLKGDGTTANFTTQNYAGEYVKFNAAGYTASSAASGTTANESAHTHSVDPPDTTSGNNSANVVVAAGAGTTVAADPHTHNTNIAPFTSGAGSAHNHAPGTLELLRTILLPYFRR